MALLPGVVGIVPFAASAAAVLWPNQIVTGQHAQLIGVAYGGLILTFLGGSHWGAMAGPVDARRFGNTFRIGITSVLVALVAMLMAPPAALALLIASYLVLALCDVLAIEQHRLPEWLGQLRMMFTTGAVLSLLTVLVASLT